MAQGPITPCDGSLYLGRMKLLLAAALVISLASHGAAAQQWVSILKGGPAELFDKEDDSLFFDTIRLVLERSDSELLSWENPKTGHRGNARLLRAFESRGRQCKEIEFHNEAKGRKGQGQLYYCRVEGQWRLLGDSQL